MCHLASPSRKRARDHITRWCHTPGFETPTVGAPGRGLRVSSRFLAVSWMAASTPSFSAGAVIWFGSLEFLATDNGSELTLLSREGPSGGRVTPPRARSVARRPHHHASPPRERRRRYHRRQAQAVPAAHSHFPVAGAEFPRRSLPGARPETSRARPRPPSDFAFIMRTDQEPGQRPPSRAPSTPLSLLPHGSRRARRQRFPKTPLKTPSRATARLTCAA